MFYAHGIHEKLTETSLQRLSIKNPFFFCYRSFRINAQGAGLGVRQLLTSGPYFCYTDNNTKIFPHHSFMSPEKAFPNRLIVPKKTTYFGSSISIDHHHLQIYDHILGLPLKTLYLVSQHHFPRKFMHVSSPSQLARPRFIPEKRHQNELLSKNQTFVLLRTTQSQLWIYLQNARVNKLQRLGKPRSNQNSCPQGLMHESTPPRPPTLLQLESVNR